MKNEFKADFTGLDKFLENLSGLGESVDNTNIDLISGELLESILSHFEVKLEDFSKINEKELDKFISEKTVFESFESLLQSKVAKVVRDALFKGLN